MPYPASTPLAEIRAIARGDALLPASGRALPARAEGRDAEHDADHSEYAAILGHAAEERVAQEGERRNERNTRGKPSSRRREEDEGNSRS